MSILHSPKIKYCIIKSQYIKKIIRKFIIVSLADINIFWPKKIPFYEKLYIYNKYTYIQGVRFLPSFFKTGYT